GSPRSREVAEFALALFKGWRLNARIETFEALLPYPLERRLEITAPVQFRARLAEPAIPEDADSGDHGQLPTYNAYSASGTVTAPLVYVNYGVPEDYETLSKLGIDVKGKIVIARYGRSWRGTKPKVAAERGAAGCLIYSDPKEDGYFEGEVYPKGPFRPPAGVQRGSIMDMPLYVGDPLSPGWASEAGAKRLPLDRAANLMKIPVLPISYEDASPLLANLGGPVAPESWRGALGFTYHVGPGPATVRLQVELDQAIRPVYNVIAAIPGSRYPDQWVLYGNHHDAWVNGGSDPASGAAVVLETARSLAALVEQGWRPKRTIMLALWDAEEFGLVGSTEWLEKHQAELAEKLVAYLNSDSNGRGWFNAGGSPLLDQFLRGVLDDLTDPVSGKKLLEVPRKSGGGSAQKFGVTAPGAGSDYTAFVHHLGIPVLNLGFGGEDSGGVYHSIYDSMAWFNRFGDPGFLYGKAFSQLMATSLVRLADAPVLPFEFSALARDVREYAGEIEKLAASKGGKVDLGDIKAKLQRIEADARKYEATLQRAVPRAAQAQPEKLARLNELLYQAEQRLLAPEGLPGRSWYKHQIYAPGVYTGYSAKTLPAVREAVEAGRWQEAQTQAASAARALEALDDQIRLATQALKQL
ncbi:MAG TPA: M28 family metallopeptidase, partial [Bryobacteraceae bacterium]|nr:M28 family metallopeptidase [Bryobacteraceae bacterium]